jgi:hypothetical protein
MMFLCIEAMGEIKNTDFKTERDKDNVRLDLHELMAVVAGMLGDSEWCLFSTQIVMSYYRDRDERALAARLLVGIESLYTTRCESDFSTLENGTFADVFWGLKVAEFKLSPKQIQVLKADAPRPKKHMRCLSCNSALVKPYKCSTCHIATFCGSACQKASWKEHKTICVDWSKKKNFPRAGEGVAAIYQAQKEEIAAKKAKEVAAVSGKKAGAGKKKSKKKKKK